MNDVPTAADSRCSSHDASPTPQTVNTSVYLCQTDFPSRVDFPNHPPSILQTRLPESQGVARGEICHGRGRQEVLDIGQCPVDGPVIGRATLVEGAKGVFWSKVLSDGFLLKVQLCSTPSTCHQLAMVLAFFGNKKKQDTSHGA